MSLQAGPAPVTALLTHLRLENDPKRGHQDDVSQREASLTRRLLPPPSAAAPARPCPPSAARQGPQGP